MCQWRELTSANWGPLSLVEGTRKTAHWLALAKRICISKEGWKKKLCHTRTVRTNTYATNNVCNVYVRSTYGGENAAYVVSPPFCLERATDRQTVRPPPLGNSTNEVFPSSSLCRLRKKSNLFSCWYYHFSKRSSEREKTVSCWNFMKEKEQQHQLTGNSV